MPERQFWETKKGDHFMINYGMLNNSKTEVLERDMLYRVKGDWVEEAIEKVKRFLVDEIKLRKDFVELMIKKKVVIPTRVNYCSNFVVQNTEETYMETHGTNLDWSRYYHVVEFVSNADYPFWTFDPEKDLYGHEDAMVEKVYVVKSVLEALVLYQIHCEKGFKTRNVYISAAAGIPNDLGDYILGYYGAISVIAMKNPSSERIKLFDEVEEPISDYYTLDYIRSVEPLQERRML